MRRASLSDRHLRTLQALRALERSSERAELLLRA
jgi:hypothetical protein